jgi:5-methyltetrahydropteroyltriglutamate--homocysteine methyltransferase
MLLIPGVIDSCSNYVEHPELVAERIVRLARLVGRENLLAGTDCGFATFARGGVVAPSVTWRKLASLAEGAAIASRMLWSA